MKEEIGSPEPRPVVPEGARESGAGNFAELQAENARLSELLAEARRIILEDEPFGSVVELLFYAPLREAESDLRVMRAENAAISLELSRARAVLQEYANPKNWLRAREDGPIDLWVCCDEEAWNGPDLAAGYLALQITGQDTEGTTGAKG